MDNASESLIRSALHDLANVLAGVRGIIDLSPPQEPLPPRDRNRLEAVIEEGMATVDRARNLTVGLFPDGTLEQGEAWRFQLEEQLQPMGVIFRCRFDVAYGGEARLDRWPGELLRGYVRAVTRQVLPYIHDGILGLECSATEREWILRWQGVALIPESLLCAPEERRTDIASRWANRVGGSLGVTLSLQDGAMVARVPRP